VAALAVLLLALAGASCGIDEDQLATGTTTSGGKGRAATTTDPGTPRISLPDIPSDVTEPESTVPDPPQPDTLPAGRTTPGGFTPAGVRDALVDGTDLTEDQATCVSIGVFAKFDDASIDELFTAADPSSVDPDLRAQFEEIVTTCVQGG
jgi:hypothetical protein